MREESMSLLAFQDRFCDEAACLDHLFRLRWPDGFICPRCGRQRFSFVSTRRLYQCSACRYQTSVTAGTVFHKTRTPIRKWFWMIFMMTRQKCGVSILRMQKLLQIGGYRTAWLMGHKIREAMAERDSDYKLAGLVEMDNVFIAPKSQGILNREAGRDRAKVLVGVKRQEKGSEFCFLGHVERMDVESLKCVAKDKPPSESDSHGDSSARAEGAGEKFGREGFRKLKWIYAVMANIKGNLRGVHHGVSAKHLQRYLNEYCYRFNRRRWDSQLFNRALEVCTAKRAVTWADVIA